MTFRPVFLAVGIAFVVLTGCATPAVDQTAVGFDERKFADDLAVCRGGPPLMALAVGVKVAAYGAWEGAIIGAVHGASSADDGALIGAAVGGAIGLGIGAAAAFEEQEEIVGSCLRKKGYSVAQEQAGLARPSDAPG